MSKCKAVLDSEKITEIQVRIKAGISRIQMSEHRSSGVAQQISTRPK
jgi:hypothetical protein